MLFSRKTKQMNYHLIYQDTKKPSILDQVRQAIKTKHYNIRTRESYVGWIKRYI